VNEHFFALLEKASGLVQIRAGSRIHIISRSLPSPELQNKNFSAN
jgi:hypothetical protein